jgi:clan AA aspartic protease (TIGR02281 family)
MTSFFKTQLLILLLVLLNPFTVNCQELPRKGEFKISNELYGFINAQEIAINLISDQYPELKEKGMIAIGKFNSNFNLSKKYLDSYLASEYGEKDFKKFQKLTHDTLFKYLNRNPFSKEQAVNFINEVENRSKGNITEDILRPLLYYQYKDQPHKEFINNYKQKYKTDNNPKANGAKLTISLPYSWLGSETEKESTVYKFTSKFGKGNEIVVISVQKIVEGQDIVTNEEIKEIFSKEVQLDAIKNKEEPIKYENFIIDGCPGSKVEYNTSMKRLNMDIHMRTSIINFFDGKYLYTLTCIVNSQNKSELLSSFNHFAPLFNLIANSIIVENKSLPEPDKITPDIKVTNPYTSKQIKLTKASVNTFSLQAKINGVQINFILDTGADELLISKTEYSFLIKNGSITEKDIIGKTKYTLADGSNVICNNILIKEFEIDGIKINNIKAGVVDDENASPLLGQNVLKLLGKINIDYNNQLLTITK